MEDNKPVTLKLIGFNDAERTSFSAVLTLAGRALKKTWQITEAAEADFFLLSAQSSATANRESLLNGIFAGRCLFCLTEKTIQAENELLVDSNHVPRLSTLVELFNKISVTPSAVNTPPSKPATQTLNPVVSTIEASSESFFDPQEGLLGYLLMAKHEQFIVSLQGQPQVAPLYIDTEKNVYYSKNTQEQLEPYLAGSAELSIQPATKAELENFAGAESLKPTSLKDLIWYIVMKTSAGRVIKSYAVTDIVALKSWPDLRLFKCLDYAKVATFMKNNAAPLEMIARETEMALTELNDFYNACYLMGLIEPRNQIEINKKNISSERLDLLNKIDARLK